MKTTEKILLSLIIILLIASFLYSEHYNNSLANRAQYLVRDIPTNEEIYLLNQLTGYDVGDTISYVKYQSPIIERYDDWLVDYENKREWSTSKINTEIVCEKSYGVVIKSKYYAIRNR